MAANRAHSPATDDTGVFATQRRDLWWFAPAMTFFVFSLFVLYATFRAFENNHYEYENYLSPFYSPTIVVNWTILGFNISPALWILIFPLLFRFTCYYYRKAYYRAFALDPPACAVGEPHSRQVYNGERSFPLVLQNIHRYAWFPVGILLIFLWWDTLLAFFWQGGIRIGFGSLLFLVNIVLLTGYSLGCHSLRHIVGGCLNCFSCSNRNTSRRRLWERVTFFNEHHPTWAWLSLISVAFTDFYVRSLSTGLFTDVRLF